LTKEKVRVYQLARELNVDTKILLDLCKQSGFDVKNQLSNLEPEQRDALEQMIKRGAHQAAPKAATAKAPVTPVLAPEQRAVPNLGRPRTPHDPARAQPPAAPAKTPPAPEVPVTPAAPAAEAPAPPSPPAPPTPTAPVVPTIKERVPTLPSAPRTGSVPTLPTGPARPAAPSPQAPTRPAAQQPAAPPPGAPVAPKPPGVPTVPATGRTPPTLTPGRPTTPGGRDGGSRPGDHGPRRPRLPGLPSTPLRPVAPPPLKPLKPLKPPAKPGEQILTPKVAITREHLEQHGTRPLRPEDLIKPQTPATEVPETEEDDKAKGRKLKEIPGRDARTKQRNERAEKRKATRAESVEIIGGGRVVIERDDREGRSLTKMRGKQGKGPRHVIHKPKGKVELETPITVRTLSEALGVKHGELLMKLVGHGAPRTITINSSVEPAMAELVAIEYGREIEFKKQANVEDAATYVLEQEDRPEDMRPRAPIVTIMGHVDHGKTSLLDKIRASNVVATEAGGITQVIRAWRVEHNGKPITFLDTPGHEAFTKMRARGAQVTDIAVIVVAADDGVMPQTKEAVQHAKAAGVSLVVAINKVDLPSANVERTKRSLYDLNVLPDNMGGDTPFVETSAATGKGIDDLLEAISLVAELKELKANPNKPARGTCLEASLSEGEGVRATLLIGEGTLRRGDVVLCGATYGRARQLYNDLGKPIEEAGPGVPVRLIGLDDVPNADDPFVVLPELTTARAIAEQRSDKMLEAAQPTRVPITLEKLGEAQITELKVILKADYRGSIEAIRKELEKLVHEEVRVRVLEEGIGHITESDVWLALTSPEDTMIVGFNAVPDDRARALAEEKGVEIREYNIIYNLTNDIKAALEGKLKPKEEVIHLGRAVIRETFKVSRVGTIAGCYVTQGVIRRNAKVRVIREGVVVYPPAERTAGLESLKRYKDDVSEVREGFECGMKIAGYDDVKVGDVIEAYRVEQVQRTLELAAAGAK
jgi:translation initiation factor IF-2